MLTKVKYLKYYSKLLLNNWFQEKDTYAQHGEDKIIEQLVPEGVRSFIDIGANDGVLFSNTFKFAKQGAKGLCIEPSTKSYWKLKLNHLFHSRVRSLNLAVSNYSRILYFEDAGYESVLSKVKNNYEQGLTRVKAVTVRDLWNKFPDYRNTDLLSIDVEGHENEVLEGAGSNPLSAKVIILETDKANEDELLSQPCLKHHNIRFSNGVNLVLTHEKLKYTKRIVLPKGFKEMTVNK